MDFNNYTDPVVKCLSIIFSFFALIGLLSMTALISLGLWKLIELLQ